jgi:hypothetical protein
LQVRGGAAALFVGGGGEVTLGRLGGARGEDKQGALVDQIPEVVELLQTGLVTRVE